MRFAAQERTMGASERAAAPALEGRLGPAPEEEAPAPGAMVAERSFRNLRRDNERLIWALLKARDRIRILEDAVADPSAPPCTYGTFCTLKWDETPTVHEGGQKLKVNRANPDDWARIAGHRGQRIVHSRSFRPCG